jgi:hypothetical protein
MISVSDKFVSIMNSNIRPKTDFKITVTGNGYALEWTSKDITNFEFKRGIDPVGRNLPFLELTWEEIYLGELNTDNEATKYNNITPYMTVELTIEQSLNFVNTWKDVSQLTWSEIFNSGMTWRDVLKKPVSESVKMPTMFLVGKPEVQNQKIRWTARDFLYFLNAPQEIGFQSGIKFANPLRYFLLDERANFKNDPKILEAIGLTEYSLKTENNLNFTLNKSTLFNGSTKNILKDYLASLGWFWVFDINGQAKAKRMNSFLLYPDYRTFKFKGDIMKSYPKIIKGKDILNFSFVQYNVKFDETNKYKITPDEVIPISDTSSVYKYFYKDFGKIEAESGMDFVPTTTNKSIIVHFDNINVIPAILNSSEIFINNYVRGEEFVENNSCNFFGIGDEELFERKRNLDFWFKEKYYTMEIEGLPVFHLEPFDYVGVETNLFENGKKVIKKGVILEQHLTFNGGFNQKTIVREV